MRRRQVYAGKISFNVLLALSLAIHIAFVGGVLLSRDSNHAPLPQLQVITVELRDIGARVQEVTRRVSEVSTTQPAPAARKSMTAPPLQQAEMSPLPLKAEAPLAAQTQTVMAAPPQTAVPQQSAIQVQSPGHQAAVTNVKATKIDTHTATIDREYIARVRALIDRQKEYPLMARRSRTEGTVYITFVLDRDGGLQQAKVSRSSGRRILDRAALNAVTAVRRFPAVPAAMDGDEFNFELPLTYEIGGD